MTGEMTGLERLRELIEDYNADNECGDIKCDPDLSCGQCMARNVLKPIADQIERERAEDCYRMGLDYGAVSRVVTDMERHVLGHEGMEDSPVARWARELRGAMDGRADEEVTDVATIRADAMEAWRWVREHGGIEGLSRLFQDADSRRVELCAALGIDLDKGWSEAMAAMRLRLMPEGVEWLRYESGELVEVGDGVSVTVHDEDGDFERYVEAESVSFDGDGVIIEDPCHVVRLLSGERVRRPTVPAADGEPLEVWQTVWDVDGHGPLVVRRLPSKGEQLVVLDNGGTNFYRYPEKLTHERPAPPDSWELIEEDADALVDAEINGEGSYNAANAYCNRRGLGEGTSFVLMAQDLVRRCRALAEREQ